MTTLVMLPDTAQRTYNMAFVTSRSLVHSAFVVHLTIKSRCGFVQKVEIKLTVVYRKNQLVFEGLKPRNCACVKDGSYVYK